MGNEQVNGEEYAEKVLTSETGGDENVAEKPEKDDDGHDKAVQLVEQKLNGGDAGDAGDGASKTAGKGGADPEAGGDAGDGGGENTDAIDKGHDRGTESGKVQDPSKEGGAKDLDDQLVSAAIHYGLPFSVVKRFATNAELESAVREMADKVNRPLEDKNEEDETEKEDILDKIKLDPDEYDEDLISMFDILKGEIKQLRGKASEVDELKSESEKLSQDQAFNGFVSDFEGTLDVLGEVGKDLFGEGKLDELDSERKDRRLDLFNEVSKLAAVYQGEPMSKLVKLAANALHGDKLTTADIKGKLKKREGAIMPKGSSVTVPQDAKTSYTSAVDKVKNILRSFKS